MPEDGCYILKSSDIMDSRAEVKPLENICQGVEADHFSGTLGHNGTEGLETGQRSVPLQSKTIIVLLSIIV